MLQFTDLLPLLVETLFQIADDPFEICVARNGTDPMIIVRQGDQFSRSHRRCVLRHSKKRRAQMLVDVPLDALQLLRNICPIALRISTTIEHLLVRGPDTFEF